jgi:hypothetical protein
MDDPPNRGAFLAEAREVDVGIAVETAFEGEAADLIGFESGAFDQFGGQGVMGDGELNVTFLVQNFFPGLPFVNDLGHITPADRVTLPI